jgi:hypothetical protein
LTLHKALIKSEMTYACSTFEFWADIHLKKSHWLQNKVFRTVGKFTRNTPITDMHNAFQILYEYDYVTKLCTQQAQAIQYH